MTMSCRGFGIGVFFVGVIWGAAGCGGESSGQGGGGSQGTTTTTVSGGAGGTMATGGSTMTGGSTTGGSTTGGGGSMDGCGNGVVDAGETCDIGIPDGQPGSCPATCNDGLSCTEDVLTGAGSCAAMCAHSNVGECVNGDGCCAMGCPADTDCGALSRIKQSVITADGKTSWYRNGYWNGSGYAEFTGWAGQSMISLIPGQGDAQAYRGIDHVVLGDGKVKQTVLLLGGTMVWSRYGTWDGSAYGNWTVWSNQLGDLTQVVPSEGVNQSYRSFDHVAFPDGRLKQTLLTADGKKIWQRYADWNGAMYVNWTAWTDQFGDLTSLIPGQGANQSFRSFNHVLFADQRLKQSALSEDGKTVWHRYGEWNGTAFVNWTAWTDQWGDFSHLLPGQGDNQVFLGFDEGTMNGAGNGSGCLNGCDDGDPCTTDTCVANSCQHAVVTCDDGDGCTNDVCLNGQCQHSAVSCDDGDACTDDSCSSGTCQHPAKSCDDGNACTPDSCVAGVCQHGSINCDDGNPCTDDSCSSGSCQHSNNSASCQGGTCQNGTCQGANCQCVNCKDSCTNQACNGGAVCAPDATCQGGNCVCNLFCGGKCCGANDNCVSGTCCPTPQSAICNGKCGIVNGPCGPVSCGTCPGGLLCCAGNYCDDICQ